MENVKGQNTAQEQVCKCGAHVRWNFTYCPHCGELLPEKKKKVCVNEEEMKEWRTMENWLRKVGINEEVLANWAKNAHQLAISASRESYDTQDDTGIIYKVLNDHFPREVAELRKKAGLYDKIENWFFIGLVVLFCFVCLLLPFVSLHYSIKRLRLE